MALLKEISKNQKTISKPIKLSLEEDKAIRELAKKYTRGNVSAWIRYASINYRPKKEELTK